MNFLLIKGFYFKVIKNSLSVPQQPEGIIDSRVALRFKERGVDIELGL